MNIKRINQNFQAKNTFILLKHSSNFLFLCLLIQKSSLLSARQDKVFNLSFSTTMTQAQHRYLLLSLFQVPYQYIRLTIYPFSSCYFSVVHYIHYHPKLYCFQAQIRTLYCPCPCLAIFIIGIHLKCPPKHSALHITN